MLPRLDAEERLADIEATALSFGSMEAKAAERTFNRLEDARDGFQSNRRRAAKASLADLQAMGVGFSPPPEAQGAS